MLTDGLRALLLQAQGYDTQVFEFISPEHTGKNKMVLALKRAQPLPEQQRQRILAQIAALSWCYGGFKATPASGWCFAHLIARDEPYPAASLLRLDRFATGHLIDEKGSGAQPNLH